MCTEREKGGLYASGESTATPRGFASLDSCMFLLKLLSLYNVTVQDIFTKCYKLVGTFGFELVTWIPDSVFIVKQINGF